MRSKTQDGQRVSRFSQVQNILREFHEQGGKYPATLKEIIREEAYYKDPYTNEPYDYIQTENGDSYLLRTTLKYAPSSPRCYHRFHYPERVLFDEKELDGVVMGLNCDDPAHCVKP